VRQLVQTNGTVLDAINYDSFGNIAYESSSTNGDRFKFTAREWDVTLGQYLYRARFYGPAIGRFLSEDPSSFAAGDDNLYRYVGNQVISFADPSGQSGVGRESFRSALVRKRLPTLCRLTRACWRSIAGRARRSGRRTARGSASATRRLSCARARTGPE
jgi:RHS repeat-associated protein